MGFRRFQPLRVTAAAISNTRHHSAAIAQREGGRLAPPRRVCLNEERRKEGKEDKEDKEDKERSNLLVLKVAASSPS